MAEGSFADFISRDRERLHAEREQIVNQQQALEGKLTDINRELAAIDAYEAAKTGKAPELPGNHVVLGRDRKLVEAASAKR